MKFSNTQVERITKDVSTIVTLEDGKEFTMCGEIVNSEMDFQSVGVAFHELKEFNTLNEDLAYKIKVMAFNEMKRLR